jgi:hypothetical protein
MVEGMNSSEIHCKNFCKCHNVPPPSTTIKNSIMRYAQGTGIKGLSGFKKGEMAFDCELGGSH